MNKECLFIENIPAIIWGNKSDKVFIYVHGKMSQKGEALSFAKLATQKGYQVLSFDLPEHGERINEDYQCNVWNGVHDLNLIGKFVKRQWDSINLYAVSLGAYFSLLAYNSLSFQKCLLVSPILNMERLIENMMKWNDVGVEKLKEKKEIPTSMGETLSWDYYCYAKENSIDKWDFPTAILYGSEDNLTEQEVINSFVSKFNCDLTVMQNGEHWFHTEQQLDFHDKWLSRILS